MKKQHAHIRSIYDIVKQLRIYSLRIVVVQGEEEYLIQLARPHPIWVF